MKCEQISNKLLESEFTLSSSLHHKNVNRISPYGCDDAEAENTKIKLEKILECLIEQKNQFVSHFRQEQQLLIQKIESQKNQIIQNLLRNIRNLQKQNEQLKFQYRKRFKIMRNIQDKYSIIVNLKDKKINEFQSVINYLENKIKFLQTKIYNNRTQLLKQAKQRHNSISPRKYFDSKKMEFIATQQIHKINRQKIKNFKNYLDELTEQPSSFFSQSKVFSNHNSAQSKVNDSNTLSGRILQKSQDQKQTDFYSSFLITTDNNLIENQLDFEGNFQCESFRGLMTEKQPQLQKTFINIRDLEKDKLKIPRSYAKKSAQVSNSLEDKRRINFFKLGT